jgi:FKBP-type peptidyl-prolyl cis-trans isomerase FklB
MHKSMKTAGNLLAVGTLLLGHALAQTPAPATPPASSTKTQTPSAKHPATAAKTAAPLALKTQKDKFSYALGMKMGANLQRQSVPVDATILARGLKDGLAGGKTLLTDAEAQAAITAVQDEMRKQQQEKMKQASDSVVCNYRGTLINGTEFDSSYKRGQPATFPVGGVIKGWTEALQLMPVGSKWQLFIPPDLAYGERGAGADIGPDSTLIFEVELLSIEDKTKEKTPDKEPEKK